jgi:hypothetical protein
MSEGAMMYALFFVLSVYGVAAVVGLARKRRR